VKYYVYILKSLKSGKLYIGQTQDLDKRLLKHNAGYNKSTKNDIPWELIFHIAYESRKEAMAQEKRLKNMKKRQAVFDFMHQNKL